LDLALTLLRGERLEGAGEPWKERLTRVRTALELLNGLQTTKMRDAHFEQEIAAARIDLGVAALASGQPDEARRAIMDGLATQSAVATAGGANAEQALRRYRVLVGRARAGVDPVKHPAIVSDIARTIGETMSRLDPGESPSIQHLRLAIGVERAALLLSLGFAGSAQDALRSLGPADQLLDRLPGDADCVLTLGEFHGLLTRCAVADNRAADALASAERAVAVLLRVFSADNRSSHYHTPFCSALERLALALQRSGQADAAAARFEEYLRLTDDRAGCAVPSPAARAGGAIFLWRYHALRNPDSAAAFRAEGSRTLREVALTRTLTREEVGLLAVLGE
ncbi:MAG: hypothetical protein ACT4PL_13180, partial [Phycisphaerales bacterium]